MHETAQPRAIHVQPRPDGALTYLVALPPEALPPGRQRDLSAAWEAARSAATAANWGVPRFFRFCRADGTSTDLALSDPDACCWAGAVDGTVGMGTSYGLSLCVRLLALVDLLASARWADHLFEVRRDGAEIDAVVLGAAATLPLTAEARFDETGFRARVAQGRLAAPTTAATRPGRFAQGATA
jgi:hypothetical protein